MTDVFPTQIGKYQLLELVGEGAMGTVYRATDTVLGRTVAIKVMNPAVARDTEHRQRFLREAQSAGSLQHPNVVTIYDLGELDGHLFIAMEFIHGADLAHLMDGTDPLKLQSRLDIIIDVLMGLAYAHKNGIIHRDIKPANIRVGDDGRARIMDFGIAHLASSDMTRTGLIVGTPSYMAPEQVSGGQVVPGTDIFAVGAVLYHLLTGLKPFEGPTLQSLFYKIVSEMPRPINDVRPGLPAALERIVRKAMAKAPEDRYQSALEMANEIIGVRAELSGNPYASTASLTASAVDLVSSRSRNRSLFSPARRPGRKTIGAAAAVVLIAGWLAFGPTSDDDPQITTALVTDTATVATPVTSPSPPAPDPVGAVTAAAKEEPETPPATPPASRPAAERRPSPALKATTTRSRPVPPPPGNQRARATAGGSSSPRAGTVTEPPAPITAPTQAAVVPAPARDTQVAAVIVPPAPAVRPPAPPPVTRPSPREEIAAAVAAYARAIESRDIGAVRRAYPGITAEQARGFTQFFQSARSINVSFRVNDLEAGESTAEARLVGTYEYVTREGRTELQPVSFGAVLRHDGTAWRLTSVR